MMSNSKGKDSICSRMSFWIMYIYILCVLWGQYAMIDSIFPPLLIVLVLVVTAYVVTVLLMKWASNWKLKGTKCEIEKKEIKKNALIYFAIAFGIFLIAYYSRFPGVYFMDSAYQLNEAVTGTYDDWHPLLHTLLVFWAPLKLGGVWLIELLQILFFCVALTYMVCTLRWYGVSKFICNLIFAFILLQPNTTYIMLFPMKDCTFAILTMLLVTQYVHIVCTKGEWMNQKHRFIFLVITTIVCTIIRHNAVLFTLPLMLAIIVYSKRSRRTGFLYVTCVAVGILIIKVPFYGLFDMEPNDGRVTETMGLPIVMLGNAVSNIPEIMGEDAKNFMYEIQDAEVWEKIYKKGDWNNIKCYDNTNFDVIEETGRLKIMGYLIDTMLRCPEQCISAMNAVTGMVWQIDGKMNWQYSLFFYDSNYKGSVYDDTEGTKKLERYDIELPLADYIADFFWEYRDMIDDSVLKYLFSYVGIYNLFLLVCCFSKIHNKKDLVRVLHILPLVAYSYGTALLLSTFDWRFFYYTYGCFFGIMYLLLREGDCSKENNEEDFENE